MNENGSRSSKQRLECYVSDRLSPLPNDRHFSLRHLFLLGAEDEKFAQSVGLTTKHQTGTRLGQLSFERILTVTIIEYLDVTRGTLIQTIFHRHIIDKALG